MLWLGVHVALCVSFLSSALSTLFPSKLPALRNAASLGHLLLGTCLLFVPSHFLGITVQGEFNTLHSFLQAYCAPFHVALAYFMLSPAGFPQEKPFVFAQVFCALLSLLTRLLTAWHLTEKSTRGLLISDHFVLCAILCEAAWLICECVKFCTMKGSNQDEIDKMSKRTTLWLEGKGSFYLENIFYFDAALSLLMAFTHFAFPHHILKLVINSTYTLDSHHVMWCRMFGCLCLLPALCSLSARHLSPHVQTHYLASRLITQVMVLLLNIFGHWVMPIYSPNHISGFMVSGFYMSFLFSSFYRANSLYKVISHSSLSQKSKSM